MFLFPHLNGNMILWTTDVGNERLWRQCFRTFVPVPAFSSGSSGQKVALCLGLYVFSHRPLLSSSPASILRMVPRPAAVPWIRRRLLGWCSTLPSPRVNAGSPSCTALTPTTTRPPKPCHATPPSTARGKRRCRGPIGWRRCTQPLIHLHSSPAGTLKT